MIARRIALCLRFGCLPVRISPEPLKMRVAGRVKVLKGNAELQVWNGREGNPAILAKQHKANFYAGLTQISPPTLPPSLKKLKRGV